MMGKVGAGSNRRGKGGTCRDGNGLDLREKGVLLDGLGIGAMLRVN